MRFRRLDFLFPRKPHPLANHAFTLVEMLAAMAILSFILVVIWTMTVQTSRVWKSSSTKLEAFQSGRAAFESMTRLLSQATLNTYYDYFDSTGHAAADPYYSGTPARYGRQSELHFISGAGLLTSPRQVSHAVFFQAPLGYSDATAYSGLDNALNAIGFYITYNDDISAGQRPGFITASLSPLKYRYRLMQFTQPLQNLAIFKPVNSAGSGWFTSGTYPAGNTHSTRVLSDNIVALVLLPKKSTRDDATGLTLSPYYNYDSRTTWSGITQPPTMNQLPPLVQVTMVAVDEPSASRFCVSSSAPDFGVDSLFQNAAQFESDLNQLTQTLTQKHLSYRIFQADIAIRGAKWSQ